MKQHRLAVSSPTRRQFVGQVAVAGAGLGATLALPAIGCRRAPPPAPAAPAAADKRPALATLSAEQFHLVSAVCDRLLPGDSDPGAIALGVPTYIDRALASPELAAQRTLVVELLPLLDRQARQRFGGRGFVEAAPDQQDSLLAAWQHGRGADARFFATLLGLTLEGAFGDPRHGGNRAGNGYALVGFALGPVLSAHPHARDGGAPG